MAGTGQGDGYGEQAAEFIAGVERYAALGLPRLPDDPAAAAAMRAAGYDVLAEVLEVDDPMAVVHVLSEDEEVEHLVRAGVLAVALGVGVEELPGAEFIAVLRETPETGPVLSGFRPLTKTCNACRETKPWSAFGRNDRWAGKVARTCKTCLAARARAAYWQDPEKARRARRASKHTPMTPEQRRTYHLQGTYKITPETYGQMLRAQDGKCPICGDPAEAVDHDHQTGRVRGILCQRCNRGLGCFRDRAELIRRALEYLEDAEMAAMLDLALTDTAT